MKNYNDLRNIGTVRATTPNGKFLLILEVLACLGSFCLPVRITVNKTSQRRKVDRWWWTSYLDLTSRSESAFSLFPIWELFILFSLKRKFNTVKIKNMRWKALKSSLASITIKFGIPKLCLIYKSDLWESDFPFGVVERTEREIAYFYMRITLC